MGCGASKSATDSVVQNTEATILVQPPKQQQHETSKKNNIPTATPVTVVVAATSTNNTKKISQPYGAPSPDGLKGAMMTRPVIPSIPGSKEAKPDRPDNGMKPVAFEISLDDEFFKPTLGRKISEMSMTATTTTAAAAAATTTSPAVASTIRKALPKLELTQVGLQSKLANTEARWKDLEKEGNNSTLSRTKEKPKLLTRGGEKQETPLQLKQRLQQKEAIIAQNRAKEIEKMQAKLAQKERRIKMVQERKKAIGNSSNEDLMRLSWGGELDRGAATNADGFTDEENGDRLGESPAMTGGRGSASTVNSRIGGMKRGPGQVFSTKYHDDSDSGKGSSAASSAINSRSGSGRVLEGNVNHNSNQTIRMY